MAGYSDAFAFPDGYGYSLGGGGIVSEPSVYHERQAAALCGVHALNSLVQAPRFNPGELADIAAELDAQVCAASHSQQCVAGVDVLRGLCGASGVLAGAADCIVAFPAVGDWCRWRSWLCGAVGVPCRNALS